MLKKAICILSITFVATILMWLYLYEVRMEVSNSFNLILSSVILYSVAMLLIHHRFEKSSFLFYLTLFVVAYGLLSFYSFRYDIFGAEDIIGEYRIASETAISERWPWDLINYGWGDRPGRYASSLGVTILPAVLSKISGIDILSLFRFVMPIIGAFIPIMLFLLTNRIFNSKSLALLTAILFIFNRGFLFSTSYMFREQIGYFFLLLSLYTMLRIGRGNHILTVISLTGLVFGDAGHFAASLGFVVLFSLIIAPLVGRIRNKIFRFGSYKGNTSLWPIWYLLYFTSVTLVWLYFFAEPKFHQLVTKIISILPLVSRVPDYLIKILTTGKLFPAGSLADLGLAVSPLLNIWYYLNVILIGLGLLVALIWFSKDNKQMGLSCIGFFIFLFFSLTVLAPWYIQEVDTGRFFAAPVMVPFLALIIWIPWKHRKRNRFFNFLPIASMFFIVLSLPLNLSLPDHARILHYNFESQFSPEIKITYPNTGFGDLQCAHWIENRISSNDRITTDFKGHLSTYLANHINHSFKSSPSFNFSRSKFIMLHELYIRYDLWYTPYYGIYPTQNLSVSEILNSGNIVYNNGDFLFQMRSSSNDN